MTRLQHFASSLVVALCAVETGCSTLPTRWTPQFPTFGSTATTAVPGTRDWWKKNSGKKELVPGQGYRIPGVPGYFDEYGRPMDAPLAEEALVLDIDEKADAGLLPGLDPKKGYAKAKAAVGLGPDQARAQELYGEGQQLLAEKQYARAAQKFESAAKRWPNSTLEQQALYEQGNCYFHDDKYLPARETYVKLLEKHPNSGRVDVVIEKLWAIGQYWEKYAEQYTDIPLTPNLLDETRPRFDTRGHAIKTYENIQLYDPTGPRADDAIMAIAGMHFRAGRYGDADYQYKLLRQEYPRSDFQFEAHLLGLQSKLRNYQGPDYDGTVLEEAKQLAKQLRTQFGNRLTPDERERLLETQAEVARATVERDMRMARHYEKTDHYTSAAVYYNEVARKAPNSTLGEEARTSLARISTQPGFPQERLAWLIGLFPENPERTRVARVPELRDSRTGDSDTRLAENVETEGVTQASGTAPLPPTTTR